VDSFNNIPPQPAFSVAPFPAPPPIDDGKNAIVDLIDVILLLVVVVVGSFFFGFIAIMVFMSKHPGQSREDLNKAISHNAWFNLPLELAVYLLLIGAMAYLVWVRHRISLGLAIRWNLPSSGRAVYAVLGGFGLAVCSDLVEIVFNRWIPRSLPITEYFQDRSSALLLAGFGILVAPLVEELFFRGFLYPAIARWTSPFPAVILTATGFAAIHGGQLAYALVPLLVIFGVGVALTVVRAVTKSVATAVLVHMAYNFTLFLQFFIGTGGFKNL